MQKFIGYKCSLCGKSYGADAKIYTCAIDGGNLDVILDFDSIKKTVSIETITNSRDNSIWRYLPLLPVEKKIGDQTPMQFVGGTPMFRHPQAAEFGINDLLIKDESRNPTASFKDRASAIVVTRAKEIGSDVVVTASTGNAGAALAGISAAVGQRSIIFAPKTAPSAKVAQLLVYGSQVILVDGTYDDAFDLSVLAATEFGWYCRNTGYNAFTVEGKKTASFEVWEYFYHQQALQGAKNGVVNFDNLTVMVSVGDGNIISGIHKGFKDLYQLGWISKVPRIIGVQSEGSAAVANAFNNHSEEIIPVKATTLADSISVDLPRDGVRAVRAATETGGTYILVPDEEIIKSIALLGKIGIFSEPAGATAYAGFQKAVALGLFDQNSKVVVFNTGSGLKDVNTAMKAVQPAPIIEPTLANVKRLIKG
jgi:threonine synthase